MRISEINDSVINEMDSEADLKSLQNSLYEERDRLDRLIKTVDARIGYLRWGKLYPVGSVVEYGGSKYLVTGYNTYAVEGIS